MKNARWAYIINAAPRFPVPGRSVARRPGRLLPWVASGCVERCWVRTPPLPGAQKARPHTYTHTHIYIYIHNRLVYIYIYTYDDSYVYQVHENKHDITLHHITLRTPVYSYTCRVYSILCASVNWGCIRTMEVGHYLGVKKRFPGFEPYPFMYESFPVSR